MMKLISYKELEMFKLGTTELIIILVIVILLFGPGRIGKIAGELGRGIKNFRDGLGPKEDQAEQPENSEEKK
jgi:sec-independent protein translocase protein TatA